MKTFMYAYNEHSESAKALSQAMGIKRIKHENSRFKPREDKVVINWGATQIPEDITDTCDIINNPGIVRICSNKLSLFQFVENQVGLVPDWTTDIDVVRGWFDDHKSLKVVERHKLSSHSGEGIRIVDQKELITVAPLYVKYIPKRDEFRVHMVDGEIIDIQQKKKRLDFDGEVNYNIRNHAGGFIYAREDIEVPECVKRVAYQANDCFAEWLAIGAMDIIYNSKLDRAYLLEINTAPGLEGRTVQLYADALKELIG